MIIQVVLPLPATWVVSGRRIDASDAEVRDPATGLIGYVRHARANWRDGRHELLLTVEVEDAQAVSAATRRSGAF